MLDGAVARATGMSSDFGGFLDSTLDRSPRRSSTASMLIYLLDTDDAELGAILVFVAAVGALLISYAGPGPRRPDSRHLSDWWLVRSA